MGSENRSNRTGYLYAIIATACWGMTFIASKIAYTAVTPGTFLCIRYVLATLFLLIIFSRKPRTKLTKKNRGIVLFVGTAGYFLSMWLLQLGTAMLDASMASILYTLSPIVIVALSILLLKERATTGKTAAILLTVIGAIVVIGSAGEGNGMAGILVMLSSVLIWAFVTVMIRHSRTAMDAAWMTIYAQAVAAFCGLPMVIRQLIIGQASLGLGAAGWQHVLAFLWGGIICAGVANLYWNKALGVIDANTCSLFYAVMPLTTAALGGMFLGETLGINFLLGGLIIFAGIIIAARSDSAASKETNEVIEEAAADNGGEND